MYYTYIESILHDCHIILERFSSIETSSTILLFWMLLAIINLFLRICRIGIAYYDIVLRRQKETNKKNASIVANNIDKVNVYKDRSIKISVTKGNRISRILFENNRIIRTNIL